MNILIIDDHPLFVDALRPVLLGLGNQVTVHVATSARKAIDCLDGGKHYDLMLIDIHLPGLDGFGFMRQLHMRFMSSPVVIISASNELALMQQALKQGAMGFVPKATNAPNWLHALHQVLNGHRYFPELSLAYKAMAFEHKASSNSPIVSANGNYY